MNDKEMIKLSESLNTAMKILSVSVADVIDAFQKLDPERTSTGRLRKLAKFQNLPVFCPGSITTHRAKRSAEAAKQLRHMYSRITDEVPLSPSAWPLYDCSFSVDKTPKEPIQLGRDGRELARHERKVKNPVNSNRNKCKKRKKCKKRRTR